MLCIGRILRSSDRKLPCRGCEGRIQQLAAMRKEVLYVIFLDLTKAYDALDRSRTLDILKGYGVGDRVRRLLATYWERSTMVAREGRYYGTEFKGERGVTQGEPLSPTIFNVVVDAVVRHWLHLALRRQCEGENGGGHAGTRRPFSMRTTGW